MTEEMKAATEDVSATTEATVRAHEALFQRVWETTSDAMALSDAEGIVLAANLAYLRLYDYPLEQIIGQSFAIIFPEEQRAWAVEQYKAVFAGGESPATFESVVRRSDGSERIVEASATFLEAAGQRTAMLSTIRDITERKAAEAALQALTETLEEQVQARTQQVQRLASKLLQAEQHVQEHTAQVLHDDLQQLLYSAKMHVKVLQDELLPTGETEMLASLIQLEQIVADALDVIRQLTIDLSPQVAEDEDLVEMFKRLGARMQRLFGLMVTVEPEAAPPVVDAPLRHLLYQCVRELLFNVVKHAGVAQARVVVGYRRGELHVIVEDAGQGFEPIGVFQATESEQSERYGIGYVRDRVSWQGGQMEIDSSPGQGTRVTFRLPVQGETLNPQKQGDRPTRFCTQAVSGEDM